MSLTDIFQRLFSNIFGHSVPLCWWYHFLNLSANVFLQAALCKLLLSVCGNEDFVCERCTCQIGKIVCKEKWKYDGFWLWVCYTVTKQKPANWWASGVEFSRKKDQHINESCINCRENGNYSTDMKWSRSFLFPQVQCMLVCIFHLYLSIVILVKIMCSFYQFKSYM